jgi:hypothetical protein
LFRLGIAAKSNALHRREPGRADPPFHRAAFAVDQLELNEPQQVAGMVDAITGTFTRHFLIFAQHRWQLQLLEVMREQDLWRARHRADRHRVIRRPAHAASPGTSAA